MKQFKRILSALLAAVMVFGMVSVIGAANVPFTDVSGHWAWTGGQIPYLVEKNVLNGYKQSNGTYLFKPDGEVTRAEFIKMLDETFGLTATTSISYSDISSSDWYAPYYQKAAAQGYILNYGSAGAPNSKITRQEATALLVRYLDLPANEKADASTFVDYGDISDNFKDYVLRAIYANIINGYNENGKSYFKPAKTLSRAEALTILYRAAGCIFNQNAYSRDGGAPEANNVITRGDVTVSRVNFSGRNIVSEGASSGTVTLTDCTVNGTLYVRGSSNLLLSGTKADEVVVSGGGKVSLLDGAKITNLVLLNTADVSVYSGTLIENLNVRSGAKNVNVTGDGAIGNAVIDASGFMSGMMPAEFSIGSSLSAVFAGNTYSGSSDGQQVFGFTPFVSADDSYYYINVLPLYKGTLYYYFTNDGVKPSASSFDSMYDAAVIFANTEVKADEGVAVKTFPKDTVSKFRYVVVQLQSEDQKFTPVVVENVPTVGSGFTTAPFVAEEGVVKFKTETSGTLCWYYAESGKLLNCAEFLKEYGDTDSKLRSEVSVTPVQTYKCQLDSKVLSDYGYVAFMLKSNKGEYFAPVVLSVGDNGFLELPTVTTPGTISFKTNVSGDLYYYYAETADLPSAEQFSTVYTKAEEGDHISVVKGDADTIKYNTRYLDDYPYLILAIRDKNKDYKVPVCVNIDYTTGFESEPEVREAGEIRFKTVTGGTVLYYYSKSSEAPTPAGFMEAYENAGSGRRGSKETGSITAYIDYSQITASSYPYMVFLFTDGTKKEYSPVVLELDATAQTGFLTAPTVKNGKVTLNVEGDGEIFYFYDRTEFTCTASDFYDYWEDADYSGKIDASKGTLELDSSALKKNNYLYLAFLPAKYADKSDIEDYFSYPYVIDIESAERSSAGSGISDYWVSDDEVDVTTEYTGYLYYYLTDAAGDLPSSADFYTKYKKADDADYIKITKGEEETIRTYDYKYLVLCLEVDDDFLSPVVIDMSTRREYTTEVNDGSNKDDYGLSSVKLMSNKTVTCVPKYDGTLTLYRYDGSEMIGMTSIEVTADEVCSIEIPYIQSGINELIDQILGGTDFYIQLRSGSNVFRACKVM